MLRAKNRYFSLSIERVLSAFQYKVLLSILFFSGILYANSRQFFNPSYLNADSRTRLQVRATFF
jgi:hypothetical protein